MRNPLLHCDAAERYRVDKMTRLKFNLTWHFQGPNLANFCHAIPLQQGLDMLYMCSWLKDMMQPVTSSIDGADSGSEDGLSRPTPLPSADVVAAAAFLSCTMAAEV